MFESYPRSAPIDRRLVAAAIGAANVMAGLLALALPETAGIELDS